MCNWDLQILGFAIALFDFIGGLLGLFICTVLLDSFWNLTSREVSDSIAPSQPLVWEISEKGLFVMGDLLRRGSIIDNGSVLMMLLFILAILSALHIIFAPILILGILKERILCVKFWAIFKVAAVVLTSLVFLVLVSENADHRKHLGVIFITYGLFIVSNFGFLFTIRCIVIIRKNKKGSLTLDQTLTSDIFQLENATVPNGILEKFVKLIEEREIKEEGLYRVSGNKTEVQLLFTQLEKNPKLDIEGIANLKAYTLTTALKELVSKRLAPPVFPPEKFDEIEQIAKLSDRDNRLTQLKTFLSALPPANFAALRILFKHLSNVAAQHHVNSMGSSNLAICWWPTLFPINIIDMAKFQEVEPLFKDLVLTLIDKSQFLFGGTETAV